MTISINYGTKVISVPLVDLAFVSTDLYELDVEAFRLILKDLEDDSLGMVQPDVYRHNGEVVLSGVTYARIFEIVNGYTVTFEDGQYGVNLVGANNNIPDVLNLNQVSVRQFNSAGLIAVTSGSGVTEQDKTDIVEGVWGYER